MQKADSKFRGVHLASIVALLVATLAIMLIGTRWGLGVGPDSMSFLGYFKHDPGLPPLYTFLVKTSELFGVQAISAAWAVNWICYVGAVFCIFLGVHRGTGSRLAAYLAALLVLTQPTIIQLQTGAKSEPLYFFLTVWGLYLFCRYLEDNGWRYLTFAAIILGLSALARYPGVVAIAWALLLILLVAPKRLSQRVLSATVFGAMSVIPITAYFIQVSRGQATQAAGQLGGRSLGLHGNADMARYAEGAESLMALLLPTQVPNFIRATFLILLLSALTFLFVRYLRENGRLLISDGNKRFSQVFPLATIGFGAAYVAFLLLSVQIEPDLPLNRRYAPPIYLALMPGFVVLAHQYVFHRVKARELRIILVALAAMLVTMNLARATSVLSDLYTEGSDFSSRAWRTSPVISHLLESGYSQTIYSNGHDAITFLTGKRANSIPLHTTRRTGEGRADFSQRLARLQSEIRDGQAIVVWLDKITWRDLKMPTEDQLISEIGPLTVLHAAEDGRIYGVPGAANEISDEE